MGQVGDTLAALVESSIKRTGSGRAARLANVFDELPLPLTEWMDSPDHMALHEEPLSEVQFGVLRHAEQIYLPEQYHDLAVEVSLKWRPVRYVNLIWMMVGKGGGKDRIAALTQLRLAYLLMCLKRPKRYLGIGATSDIHFLNTATSEGQGEQVFFSELKGLLEHAPWFRGRYSDVKQGISYDKGIEAISGSSKEEAQEGLNLLLGVLDEIDAFRTKEEREKTARTARGAMLNAEGIYDMMRTSGSSRFPFLFKVMGLSWPRYQGSFIHTKHREGYANLMAGNPGRTYVVPFPDGAPTWVSNPMKRREMYDADYLENPELSRARYECKPPASENPYFRNHIAIDAAFRKDYPDGHPPITVTYRWGLIGEAEQVFDTTPLGEYRRERGLDARKGWQIDLDYADWFRCTDSYPRAIHVDTALSNDRLGIAMSYVRGWTTHKVEQHNEETNSVETVERRRPLVTTDLVMYLEAPGKHDPEHPKGEIELRWVRRIIYDIIGRGFIVARVTYDGFQSADSIQLLQAAGIEAEYFSLDRNMEGYDTAKSVLYSGGLVSYRGPEYSFLGSPEKVDLLVKELKALTIINGKKVDHPSSGSKDVADAWAGSVAGAIYLAENGWGTADDLWTPGMPIGGMRAALTGQAEPPQHPGSVTGAGVPADLLDFGGTPGQGNFRDMFKR